MNLHVRLAGFALRAQLASYGIEQIVVRICGDERGCWVVTDTSTRGVRRAGR